MGNQSDLDQQSPMLSPPTQWKTRLKQAIAQGTSERVQASVAVTREIVAWQKEVAA